MNDFRAQYSVRKTSLRYTSCHIFTLQFPQVGKLIGKGQFGRVYVAVDVVTGDTLAAKIISVSKVLVNIMYVVFENFSTSYQLPACVYNCV